MKKNKYKIRKFTDMGNTKIVENKGR